MIESLMERLAIQFNKSSLDIRKANMDPILQVKILTYMDKIAETSDYKKREKEVEDFNKVYINHHILIHVNLSKL